MRLNYWLDPCGILHDCGRGIAVHNEYARQYLINNSIMTEDEIFYSHMCPYQILHDMGWVRVVIDTSLRQVVQILGNCINLQEPMYNTMDPAMNRSQLAVCKKLCYDYNFELYNALNGFRF